MLDSTVYSKVKLGWGVAMKWKRGNVTQKAKRGPGRPPKGTPDWRPKFLEALSLTGIVLSACNIAGVSRHVAYRERLLNDNFAFAWGLAMGAATDLLEAEARRRALEGVPHYVKVGDEVLTETRYSDTLLLALLKAHRPGKFRDDGMEGRLTKEEARTWTPQMIAEYRAGASLDEVRMMAHQLAIEVKASDEN
jgi:hypothetical protein